MTLVKSEINYILQSTNGVPTLTATDDLVGLSRSSASGTLYYEDKKFSARVTGNYRSGFIRTVPSGAADSDVIGNKAAFYMDFSASYQVTPQIGVLLEAQNLTDERSTQYIDSNRQDTLFDLRNGRTLHRWRYLQALGHPPHAGARIGAGASRRSQRPVQWIEMKASGNDIMEQADPFSRASARVATSGFWLPPTADALGLPSDKIKAVHYLPQFGRLHTAAWAGP